MRSARAHLPKPRNTMRGDASAMARTLLHGRIARTDMSRCQTRVGPAPHGYAVLLAVGATARCQTRTFLRGSRYSKNVSSLEYGGAQQQRNRSSLLPLF